MVKIETVTLKGNNDYQTNIKTLSVEANMKQSRIVCKHCNRYVKPIRDQSILKEDFSEDEWEEIKDTIDFEITCSKCGNTEYVQYIGMKHINQNTEHYKVIWAFAEHRPNDVTVETFEEATGLTHSSKFPIIT